MSLVILIFACLDSIDTAWEPFSTGGRAWTEPFRRAGEGLDPSWIGSRRWSCKVLGENRLRFSVVLDRIDLPTEVHFTSWRWASEQWTQADRRSI
jgi:hypothetical protein